MFRLFCSLCCLSNTSTCLKNGNWTMYPWRGIIFYWTTKLSFRNQDNFIFLLSNRKYRFRLTIFPTFFPNLKKFFLNLYTIKFSPCDTQFYGRWQTHRDVCPPELWCRTVPLTPPNFLILPSIINPFCSLYTLSLQFSLFCNDI